MRKNRKGFTLLELIIVVIVIGILASIALPRYIRIAEKGRCAEAKTFLGEVKNAQMRYAAQWGNFTPTLNNLDVNFQTARFFTTVANGGGAIGSETALVGTATRNNVENPTGSNYVCNITQAGNISGDAACILYL
jgi:prepilin-type N-terminal cleavage/methylation domain-containing protein